MGWTSIKRQEGETAGHGHRTSRRLGLSVSQIPGAQEMQHRLVTRDCLGPDSCACTKAAVLASLGSQELRFAGDL